MHRLGTKERLPLCIGGEEAANTTHRAATQKEWDLLGYSLGTGLANKWGSACRKRGCFLKRQHRLARQTRIDYRFSSRWVMVRDLSSPSDALLHLSAHTLFYALSSIPPYPRYSSLTCPAFPQKTEVEAHVQQITTGDTNAVKNLLDDMAVNYMQDKAGYLEDKHPGNIRLVLMVASVAVACIAQFYEKIDTSWAFPANRGLLFLCVSLYFILSTVLQYILSFVDFDIIHYALPKQVRASSSPKPPPPLPHYSIQYIHVAFVDLQNKPVKDCGVIMRTRFPRFSEFFTIMFEWSDDPKSVHFEEISGA